MKTKRFPRSTGFTLVELLVVMAIVVVLVAITATAVFRFRKSADKTLATNNLRQLQAANTAYAGEHNGRYVPPNATVEGVPYAWFENPYFVSQIKGDSATFISAATPDTSFPISMMDPAVVRARPANYKSLAASFGYTTPSAAAAGRQAQITDASRTAAFITADDAFADFGAKSNIAYRHNGKAIAVFYDGHAETLSTSDVSEKSATSAFWPPVLAAAP